MRALLVLIGLAALVLVAAMSLGLVNLHTTQGSLPHLAGGTAPKFDAKVAKIGLGMENTTGAVPTVTTTQRTISVPRLSVEKPANSQ